MPNPAGLKDIRNGQFVVDMNVKNTFRQEEGMQGLFYECVSIPEQSFAVLTTCSDVTCKPEWANTGWRDGIQEFWDDFRRGRQSGGKARLDFAESRLSPRGPSIGSVVSSRTAAPGEEIFFEFVLSWYYPYRNKYWEGYEEYNSDCCNDSCCCTGEEYERNYYATLFRDAWDAGGYLIQNLERLEKATKDFHRALHRETTLPPYIIDAVSANMTVMRSPTCFRIEDGTLAGWEGCHDNAGCCPGPVPMYGTMPKPWLFSFLPWNSRSEKWNSCWRPMKREAWPFVPIRSSAGPAGVCACGRRSDGYHHAPLS